RTAPGRRRPVTVTRCSTCGPTSPAPGATSAPPGCTARWPTTTGPDRSPCTGAPTNSTRTPRPGPDAVHSRRSPSRRTCRRSAVGSEDGLTLDFGRTIAANTFDAHRLVQLAGPDTARGAAVLTALFHARFTRGLAVDDPEVLVGVGAEAGIGEEAVRALLAAPKDGPEGAGVTSDEALAARIGVRGVPFFVADRRLAVSGAQAGETLTRLLDTALDSPAEQ